MQWQHKVVELTSVQEESLKSFCKYTYVHVNVIVYMYVLAYVCNQTIPQ